MKNIISIELSLEIEFSFQKCQLFERISFLLKVSPGMKYILELSVFINRIDIPLKFRPKSNFPLECGLYERIDFLLNISPEMEFPFKNCKFS